MKNFKKILMMCTTFLVLFCFSLNSFAEVNSNNKSIEKFELYSSLLGKSDIKSVEKILHARAIKLNGAYFFGREKIKVSFINYAYEGEKTNMLTSNILTKNKNITLKGVKIGDSIEAFEKAFGSPRFKWNDMYEFGDDYYYQNIKFNPITKKVISVEICYSKDGSRG